MNIPNFINTQYVKEDGFLTGSMNLYNDELNRSLKNGLSDDGWTIPQQTTANIERLSPLIPNVNSMPDGTIWYCTDHVPPVFVGKVNGVLVQFTTTPFP